MADSLPDLVARLRATTPALADVPDDVLTAEVVRQLQARDGPSVGDALGVPVFRTSNEKDPSGAAVVRAPVVFDDALIDILRKYGLLAPLAGASVGEALRAAPDRQAQ